MQAFSAHEGSSPTTPRGEPCRRQLLGAVGAKQCAVITSPNNPTHHVNKPIWESCADKGPKLRMGRAKDFELNRGGKEVRWCIARATVLQARNLRPRSAGSETRARSWRDQHVNRYAYMMRQSHQLDSFKRRSCNNHTNTLTGSRGRPARLVYFGV